MIMRIILLLFFLCAYVVRTRKKNRIEFNAQCIREKEKLIHEVDGASNLRR